ncbi:MAG: NYN domain-containing protein [Elusimicrobiota bacterium]
MGISGRALIIDGSNAVHDIFGPFLDRAQANECESDIALLLNDWARNNPDVDVELFFDGARRQVADAPRIHILFSESGPADAIIVERTRALRYARRRVSVVTRDGDLARAANAEGAKIMNPDLLWRWISSA